MAGPYFWPYSLGSRFCASINAGQRGRCEALQGGNAPSAEKHPVVINCFLPSRFAPLRGVRGEVLPPAAPWEQPLTPFGSFASATR